MHLKNFTPHEIKVVGENGEVVRAIQPEGVQVRVKERVEQVEPIDGVPVVYKEYAEIEGLPPYEDGVTLIVSVIVLNASDRGDLVCPDTGPESVVRDEKGNILGVKRFQKR